ncbi:MAG: hypothetical protein WB562_17315 [Candidatus Sulfotelmatobacter sp.]
MAESNLSAVRAVVAKLASPTLRDDPNWAAEITQQLSDLGVQKPADVNQIMAKAQTPEEYQKLLDEIDAYLDPLVTSASVTGTLKLAGGMGAHCPLPGKLAHAN